MGEPIIVAVDRLESAHALACAYLDSPYRGDPEREAAALLTLMQALDDLRLGKPGLAALLGQLGGAVPDLRSAGEFGLANRVRERLVELRRAGREAA